MSNRIFLDSSILVEKAKGTRIDLFDYLITSDYELCISQITLSEFTFYLLAIEGGKAPVTLKRDGSIPAIIAQHNPATFLQKLTFLPDSSDLIPIYLHCMEAYNLMPNDALILAVCKQHTVGIIASYDSDFADACQQEGIQLIKQVADLQA